MTSYVQKSRETGNFGAEMGSTGLGSVKKVPGSRPGTRRFWPSTPGQKGWLASRGQRYVFAQSFGK